MASHSVKPIQIRDLVVLVRQMWATYDFVGVQGNLGVKNQIGSLKTQEQQTVEQN